MPNIVKPSGINQLWAAGGTKVDPGLQKLNIGWVVELPPYQYQNWLDNRQDTFIAHINQHGIPEWDGETEYQGNLSYTQGSDGFIYKCLATHTNFNPVNPLNSGYWVRAFEAYGSVAVVQNQLTQHLTNYATLSGITNPVAARNNLSVYSKVESDGRFAALNGNSSQPFNVATATGPNHAVPLGQLASLLLQATESQNGQVSLATTGETEVGTNDTKAITPLKASNVYVKKSSNLAGLANYATARSNLGLGDIATESASSFLRASSNLAELTNVAVARANLGLGTISTQPIGAFLQTGNNLADVPNVAAARNSLGLVSTATTPINNFLLKGDNLTGLTNVASARNNLGLSDAAITPASSFMFRVNNLADLTNVQAARNNLGLTNGATINFGGLASGQFFDMSQFVDTVGFMNIGAYKLQWGSFSLGSGGGAAQFVSFREAIGTPLFYGTGVDDSAEQMIGVVNITSAGMVVKKGVADRYARTGRWWMFST
ncbi:hypothetical protein CNR37_00168 [Pseudomonas phage ventosus]|uniref:Tail fiber protein n=1 Tax=Pseudomonas phage ventosus TaxID=2048980 RepID=A0A2H4P862_9CAUD|nr:hypothetical protein CNR37_00168 [Pseudomonas phage ventosus]